MFIASTLALAMATTGCASRMVDVRAGSEQVSLATPDQVVNCAPRGNVTVSVLTSVGFVSRSAEAVEANLLQLARNSAVNEGADTLVRKESSKFGERTFGLYKCRP
ncbi:MAG: DUF4156 domain-containing protein [Thiobacillus sp.]